MRLGLCLQGAAVLFTTASGFALQTFFGLVPLQRDPTLEMKDWSPVVAQLTGAWTDAVPSVTFFFTRSWFESGHLALALHSRVPVACFDLDARGLRSGASRPIGSAMTASCYRMATMPVNREISRRTSGRSRSSTNFLRRQRPAHSRPYQSAFFIAAIN